MPSIRLLLVEDDQAFAQRVQAALDRSEIGFDVVCVATLAAALDELRMRPFNLVLLGLNLPDSQGLGTIDALHAANPKIPIVVLTGVQEQTASAAALARGAQQCLERASLDTRTLVATMRKAVQLHRLEQPQQPERAQIAGVDPHVDQLLSELEEDVGSVGRALSMLDHTRLDAAGSDAIHAAQRHLAHMRARISGFRGRR